MSSTNVLVTGASSGIGRATALLFAERGARVFGTSRQVRPDEGGVRMLRLDVRSDASVRECVGEVLAQVDGLDILINNAGVMHEGFAEETSPEEARAVFETNFFGAVRLVNAVLPGMRERRRGRIVNVGSLAAWVGEPGEGFYAASKAALARYTESLRHEVWHLGIKVCLVEPGVFTTAVLNGSTATGAAIADYYGPRESARATLHSALRKGEDPREAARIIWKAATRPAPRGRYGAGRQSFVVPRLKTLAPQRLVDIALRRAYRLP
ncbi:SDR family NAD(P)-dependent oxidoreductase [Actinomadura latina]|uniref:SDR family NAD(P)-dependent oxidoreductase n=1 Tax=Actinomadura latina TaxID=163603 RepID=A0A846Z4B8_9ACTN|nr:SDR family NAD(P)-dependent oxidoreductase [Actinomadura latina]NKZ07839.1 SDR family NAD(P)-dependent oxidoreductase [Actinomadura latina]